MPTPQAAAAALLNYESLGVLGDVGELNAQIGASGSRRRLPMGGYLFSLATATDAQLATYNRVRQHVESRAPDLLFTQRLQLHAVSDVASVQGKYGANAIEAVRSLVQPLGQQAPERVAPSTTPPIEQSPR
jgi:hypothetical protein